MKSLFIPLLIAAAFFVSCQKEEPIPKPTAQIDYIDARLEIAVRGDSGAFTITDSYGLDVSQYFDSSFTHEWEVIPQTDVVIWGYNFGGFGDSVVVMSLYLDDLLDTTVVSGEFSNTASIYTTIE